jgi:ABC-type polysaccharide/polyol phosphate transport system ATPase subunit
MPFIADSKSDRRILTVDQLTLKFPLKIYQPNTLRDLFVDLFDPGRAEVEDQLPPEKDVIVADKLSFSINEGERVALLGVNGSGKTALCRCIAGTYKPDAGRISVRGETRAVFDIGIGIEGELTGRENALLMSSFLFPKVVDREKLIEEVLAFSELGPFLDAPLRTYSRGMQSRLGLSVVSALPCDLLILDEVFEGADQFFRDKISKRMLKIIDQSGACIFVSHIKDQIELVCNRAIVLGDGKILFDGSVAEGINFYSSKNTSGAAII